MVFTHLDLHNHNHNDNFNFTHFVFVYSYYMGKNYARNKAVCKNEGYKARIVTPFKCYSLQRRL